MLNRIALHLQETMDKLGGLPAILNQVGDDLKDPDVMTRKQTNRKSQHYDNLVNIQAHIDDTTASNELLRNMLRNCGDSQTDLPTFYNNSDSNPGSIDNVCAESTDSNLTEDSANSKTSSVNPEVSNVSVSSRTVISESRVNKSWNQMVSAAEIVNGEYIDLISFMDEDGNNSIDTEHNGNGSQMSISQGSTIASSGYQSFGYSHCSTPVDNARQEVSPESLKSPNNNYTHSTPLSFSNPMYRHTHRGFSSHRKTSSPFPQVSSSSSINSEDINSVKNYSPVRSLTAERHSGGLKKKVSSFANSSSVDSVPDSDKFHHSVSANNMCSSTTSVEHYTSSTQSQSNSNVSNVSSLTMEIKPKSRNSASSNSSVSTRSKDTQSATSRKYSLELRGSSPVLSLTGKHNSTPHSTTYYNTIGSVPRRTNDLSHSMEFTSSTSRYAKSDQMRRTATDTSISQRSSSSYSDGSGSPRSQMSSDDSSLFRRLSAQNAVHMGIRSVQRRIHEQEKTKQEVSDCSAISFIMHRSANIGLQVYLKVMHVRLLKKYYRDIRREIINEKQLNNARLF